MMNLLFLPSKRLLISCIWLLTSLIVFAQAGKGIKLIEKGDYEAAKSELLSSLNDEKEQPIGLYGLAQLYLSPGFSGYEPDSAMSYVDQAEKVLRKMDYKLKNKIQKDVNTSILRKFQKEITERAYERAQEQNTLLAYQHFLEFYPKPSYKTRSEATKKRNELAFDEAQAAGTWQAQQELLDEFGSSLKEKNPDLFKETEMKFFEGYLAENGFTAYDTFALRHPENVYVKDSLIGQFVALQKSENPIDYQNFINSNQGRPFAKLAQDSLASKLIQYGDQKSLLDFMERNPDHERMREIHQAYYHAYLIDQPNLKAVVTFEERYPDYPFPEELAIDKEKYLNLEVEKWNKSEELIGIKSFIDAYPDHPKINQLWMHFYNVYRNQNPQPEALDKFVDQYPEFPFRDRIPGDKVLAQKEYLGKLMAGDDWQALAKAIQANPEDEQIDAAWLSLYKMYPLGEDPLGALAQFQKLFPDFPMQERLQKDLLQYQLSQAAEDYDRVIKSDSQEELRTYLERYPQSPQRDRVMTRLYDFVSQENDLGKILAFEATYPDFPNQKRLENDKKNATVSLQDLGAYNEGKTLIYNNFIQKKAPGEEAMIALRRMIYEDLRNKRWSEAGNKIKDFKPYFKEDAAYREIYGILLAPDQGTPPEDMGEGINTDKDEYAASMSADGKLLFFCRNIGGLYGNNEDVFVSRKVNGEWLDAKPVKELNGKGNEAPEGVSADGNRMIVFKNGKLCYSDKTATGWAEPTELPATINKNEWQADARITADGKAILFSAGSSWGQKDIYVSELQANGKWGPAKSLGPKINTDKTDRSAFLHPDMKTLYFSSEGRNGLGGLDVYVSKKLDDSWTNWSEPINLGTSINTTDNDWGFKVTTGGDYAYFAVESDQGSSDIYMVKVPAVFQPDRVTTISGKLQGIDGKPVEAEIEWIDLKTGEVVQITRNDPETGEFFATLPNAGKFGYSIRKEGFFPLSGNIEVGKGENNFQLEKEMTLATVAEMKEKEIKIPLNNLFFETASFDIQPTSFPQLDRLATWIRENNLAIEIQGHTDDVGAESINQQLSENRAKAVRQYLIKKGVGEAKVTALGYGENKPVASNETEQGRASNRRVEIQLK